jgi:uncharacterized protein YbaR (Trm112 family)
VNLDPELLEIIVCPDCHGSLRPDDTDQTLTCTRCGLVYPVVDDIPVLLVDEARRPGRTAERPER